MTENPFKPNTPIEKTDPDANRKVVSSFLGNEASREYADLMSPEDQSKKRNASLTEAEEVILAVEKNESAEWNHEDYIEWAESIGKDADWINNCFIFPTRPSEIGKVECRTKLDLSNNLLVTALPPNLCTVYGEVILDGCKDFVELPTNLYLTGHLHLGGCDSLKTLPSTLEVGWSIFVPKFLAEAARQLKREGRIGRSVMVVPS